MTTQRNKKIETYSFPEPDACAAATAFMKATQAGWTEVSSRKIARGKYKGIYIVTGVRPRVRPRLDAPKSALTVAAATLLQLLQASRCALADLEGLVEENDIDPDGDSPAARTIRELRDAIAQVEREMRQVL